MRVPRLLTTACALASLAACELQEVTTTQPTEFVVAEVVLQAGTDAQYAYLHRGVGSGSLGVEGARVQVFPVGGGDTLTFAPVPIERCLAPLPVSDELVGSCYGVSGPGARVQSGAVYGLRIQLPGGGELVGETRVPGELQLVRPASAACALPPETTLELLWREVPDAWVYAIEAHLRDIYPVLVQRGVVPDTPNVPLRLSGVAVGANDTTIALPGELGLFDRFDAQLHPVLVALQEGLPEGVRGAVIVTAADRNYVNWARGGNFNPSGLVRVPSVRGAGTGVFGSMSTARFELHVSRQSQLPPCS